MTEHHHKIDKTRAIELYKILNEKYPNVINQQQVLANSIANEIHQALKIKVKEAEAFCIWYKGLHYKKLLVEGVGKMNLKGQIIGVVTKQEADKAKEYIEKKQQR